MFTVNKKETMNVEFQEYTDVLLETSPKKRGAKKELIEEKKIYMPCQVLIEAKIKIKIIINQSINKIKI